MTKDTINLINLKTKEQMSQLKRKDPMNWTKGMTQLYGITMCVLGIILGSLITYIIITI